MADIIKMEYDKMEDMARAYGQAAQDLEQMGNEVNNIASMVEGGGLIGDAGASLAEALKGPLLKSVQTLQAKMTELQGDIQGALQDMQDADTDTTRFYN